MEGKGSEIEPLSGKEPRLGRSGEKEVAAPEKEFNDEELSLVPGAATMETAAAEEGKSGESKAVENGDWRAETMGVVQKNF